MHKADCVCVECDDAKPAKHWGPWLQAGLREVRQGLARRRLNLSKQGAVPPEVKRRGIAAISEIIAEIDTQLRDLDFGWAAHD